MGLPVLIDQGQFRDNFAAWLSDPEDDDRIVGEVRRGHNIMTYAGRHWLSRLVGWATIQDVVVSPTLDDVPQPLYNAPSPPQDWLNGFSGNSRVRWFGVGTGRHPIAPGISQLHTPAAVNATPDYVKLASVAPGYPDASRPVSTAVVFTCQFTTAELPGDPDVTEAAIFADANDTAGTYGIVQSAMPATTQYPVPVAYKTFDPPLSKTGSLNLNLTWQLRF